MLEKIFTWLAAYATPILLAAMFAAGAGLGWMANGWRWESRVVALERDAARREATLSDEIVQALELTLKAERRGDELVAALIAAQDERSILAREKDDAIRKNTTGRRCLDAPLVGLLNAAGGGAGVRLPAASSGAFGSNAAAAADTGVGDWRSPWATDTDVALWARDARDRYDACRVRIDALRQFYDVGAQPSPSPLSQRERGGNSLLSPSGGEAGREGIRPPTP